MVFKRRDKLRPVPQLLQVLWPKGGWHRAARYLSHRVNRLPDTPKRISRGILVGVCIAFTPFFGLHFVLAAFFAMCLRGNILAAVLATFVGNPLTYLPITLVSMEVGYFLIGGDFEITAGQTIGEKFLNATGDLRANIQNIFTGEARDWAALEVFWHDVFWPYLLGGLVMGLVSGLFAYLICLPMITAYQHRRRGHFKARLSALRAKAAHRKPD